MFPTGIRGTRSLHTTPTFRAGLAAIALEYRSYAAAYPAFELSAGGVASELDHSARCLQGRCPAAGVPCPTTDDTTGGATLDTPTGGVVGVTGGPPQSIGLREHPVKRVVGGGA